jgi:hypothetical protein
MSCCPKETKEGKESKEDEEVINDKKQKQVSEVKDIKSIECNICCETLRLPYSFNCGHGMCITCTAESLNRCLNCPFCRKKIRYVTPNFTLMELLDQNNTETTDDERSLQTIINSFFDDNDNFNMSSISTAVQSIHSFDPLLQAFPIPAYASYSDQTLFPGITVTYPPVQQQMLNTGSTSQGQQAAGLLPPLIPLPSSSSSSANNNTVATLYGYESGTIGYWRWKNEYEPWMTGYMLLCVAVAVSRNDVSESAIRKCKAESISKVANILHSQLRRRLPENFNTKMAFDWVWADITSISPNNIYTKDLLGKLDFNFLKWVTRSHRAAKKSSRNSLVTYLTDKQVNKEDIMSDLD